MGQLIWRALNIVAINLVLSGDNAVVIGMAAHRLAPAQRRLAIIFGGTVAIVLLVGLTAVAAQLLQIPGLRLVGGALLIWIAIHLLQEEEESHKGIKVAYTLREAITTIMIADLVMSTDNVIGVAAASHGDFGLLVFGMAVGMAILMFLGGVLATLLDRLWWLVYVGSGIIAWTGAGMPFDDPLMISRLGQVENNVEWPILALVTVATLAFAHWFHRVRPRRTRGDEKSGA
jgi:YjbE family integral membrane protein